MMFSHTIAAVVVDASSMVQVLEGDPEWTDRLAVWQDQGAVLLAPPHFRSEMANALLLSVGLEPVDVMARLRQLFRAGVDVIDRGFVGLFDAIELAARHHLSVYDASYLALALELEGDLATVDRALAAAARAEGLEVID